MAARRKRSKASRTSPRQVVRQTRYQRLLLGIVAFYVAVLTIMVASDHYSFVAKSLIVPVLLLAALLSGRLKRFVNDWVVFVAAVEFFDFCRGLAFALTSHFELPMHLQYVVSIDRWLCRGAIAPVSLQQLRAGLSNPFWLDRFLLLVYSSHFVFFLVFGLLVWFARPQAFRAYKILILGTLYGGLIGYFLVPTIPPWMASIEFAAIPPLTHFVRAIYNVHVPRLLAAFDVNAIAAMPSLHAAMPAACALFALRHFGKRGLPAVVYALLVWIAVIYLGEHYLTDVLAGVLLALVVHLMVAKWVAVADDVEGSSDSPEPWHLQPILVALGLVTFAYGVGQLSARWIGALPITEAFVKRELLGRSTVDHYLLGRIAYEHADYPQAEIELSQSLDQLTEPVQQRVIRSFLGSSAFQNGHLAMAITALEPLRTTHDDVDGLVILGKAYVESGRYDDGVAVLREALSHFPDSSGPAYWLARYQYSHGDVDRAAVLQTAESLKRLPSAEAEPLRRALTDLVREDRAQAP